MEDQHLSDILKYLAVNVTSKETRMTLESLTLGLMKEYFRDIHLPKRHIDASIKSYIKLQSVDVKPRKEEDPEDINASDNKTEELQRDKSTRNEEEDKEEEDTQEDEEYFPRHGTKTPSRRVQKDRPKSQILGDKNAGVITRRQL